MGGEQDLQAEQWAGRQRAARVPLRREHGLQESQQQDGEPDFRLARGWRRYVP